jgi:hypothetical protein
MSSLAFICIKQDIRIRIVALDYTLIFVISFSTIFQDTLSHPGPYSSFQHAAAYLVGGLDGTCAIAPNDREEKNKNNSATKWDARDSWHLIHSTILSVIE